MSIVKKSDGLWWPMHDTDCRSVIHSQVSDMNKSVNLCERKELVFQAGGNVGVWPLVLSKKFKKVLTVEPDPVNFDCLLRNTFDKKNIDIFKAALSYEQRDDLAMFRWEGNCGAHYVDPTEKGNTCAVTIDMCVGDLECNLIILDVEGYEFIALQGATRTIQSNLPVIHFEDKGLSDKYGTKKGHVEQWLKKTYGYEVAERVHRDVIMRHPQGN